MTVKNLLEILREIKQLIQKNTDDQGNPKYNVDKVYIALELVKKELQVSMK